MKWSDILAVWSSLLIPSDNKDLIDTEQFLSCGTFDETTQIFSVQHTQLQGFVALLCTNDSALPIVRLLTQFTCEHIRKGTPLQMRVTHDATNTDWTKLVSALFQQRWILNLRSVLHYSGSVVGLEYCGYSGKECFLLQGAYLAQIKNSMYNEPNTQQSVAMFDEFSIVAFQILWTFAVLSQLGLYMLPPDGDMDIIFDTIMIQRGRVEHFSDENNSENVYFSRHTDFRFASGVYCVPARRAFAIIRFEPEATPHFAYATVLGHKNTPIQTNSIFEPNQENAVMVKENDLQLGQYFSVIATAFKRYVFSRKINDIERTIAPLDEKFMTLYRSLHDIQYAKNQGKNSIDAFFDSSFAQLFWKKINVQDKPQVVQILENPAAFFTVLHMPVPVQSTFQTAQTPERKFKQNWCCFPNIENNCFLNSVLYMLMCPVGETNSFAQSVSHYAKMSPPSDKDFAFIQSIKTRLTVREDAERARNLLAQIFCQALYKAFTLSNYGSWSREQIYQVNTEITLLCRKLLPLLDIWSLVKRGVCLTSGSGEFQDLDECLLLLCSLLQFEYCCVSTVQITEEIRSITFDLAEEKQLTTDDMEQLSLMEKHNPLRLQVNSSLEPPLIRLSMEWINLADAETGVVNFQTLCNGNFLEYSMSPAPQRDAGNDNNTAPRATRFYGKRHLWSFEKKLVVVHLPRRNSLNSLYVNTITFPDDELLEIAGQPMRIASMVLWANGHYTSLVKDDGKWWHVNDLAPPGMRCQEFGNTLHSAVEVVNYFKLYITAVTCVTDEVPSRQYSLSRQLCIEIDKLSMQQDSLKDNCIVFKKDQQQFSSLQTTLEYFMVEVTNLPERFNFGHDNPNLDFHFRDSWYEKSFQFPQQKVKFALVLAHGIKPGCAPSSRLLTDNTGFDVVHEEERVRRASTLFGADAVSLMQARAEKTCGALTDNVDSAPFIDMGLDILQMNHLALSARDYIAHGGSKNLCFEWFDEAALQCKFSATCWMLPCSFYSLLCVSVNQVCSLTWRSKDSRPFRIFNADDILIPICDANNCWALIRAQPQFRRISYYDSLARDGAEHCTKIAHYFMAVQKTMIQPEPNYQQSTDDWTMRNVYDTPLLPQQQQQDEQLVNETDGSAVLLLYFCREIFSGRGHELEAISQQTFGKEKLFRLRNTFSCQLELFGNLEAF